MYPPKSASLHIDSRWIRHIPGCHEWDLNSTSPSKSCTPESLNGERNLKITPHWNPEHHVPNLHILRKKAVNFPGVVLVFWYFLMSFFCWIGFFTLSTGFHPFFYQPMILPHHRGPCVHPQFTTKTSLGIPRTPKPRVQFLLFFCLDSPSVHPCHKKNNKKTFWKVGSTWKTNNHDFHPRKNPPGAVRHAECSSLGLSSLGLWSKTVNTNGLRGSRGFGWWCGGMDGGCSIETP